MAKKKTTTIAAGFGQRLREQRESRGWSLRELAEQSGCSHSSISLIENNRGGRTGIDAAEALARALGVRVCWLAYGEGEP